MIGNGIWKKRSPVCERLLLELEGKAEEFTWSSDPNMSMAKKTWSPEKQGELMLMFESRDFATSEMADRLGVSIPTVYNRLRRLGLKTTELRRRYRAAFKFEFSSEEKQLMRELAKEGLKVTDISMRLGRTLGPTRRIFRELGLVTQVSKPLKIGSRFGSLTVVGPAPSEKTYKGHNESRSNVLCECGETKAIFNFTLRSGNTTSCGCRIHRRNPDRDWVRHFCSILSGARVRHLDVRLSLQQVKYICSLPCAYCGACGVSAMRGRKSGRSDGKIVLRLNGIDRIDPKGGYESGNIVPCCIICNRAKSNLDLDSFVLWMQRLGSRTTASKIRRLSANIDKRLEGLSVEAPRELTPSPSA